MVDSAAVAVGEPGCTVALTDHHCCVDASASPATEPRASSRWPPPASAPPPPATTSCSARSWTSTAASTPSASPATEPRASSRRLPWPRRLPPRQAVPRRARGRRRSPGRRCRLGGERDGRGEESPSDHAAGSRGQIGQSIYLVSYSDE
ncbi:hypothetical protein VPH35_089047 [Triticum aestivum]